MGSATAVENPVGVTPQVDEMRQQKTNTGLSELVVPKPDEAFYKEQMAEEAKIVEEYKKTLATLNDKIADRSGGREEYQRQRDNLRVQLDDTSAELQKLETERTDIQNTITQKQKTGRDLRMQATSLQKNIGFKSEEDIDRRIQELNQHMVTTSKLSLKAERELIADIEKLKKSKPQLKKVAILSAEADQAATDQGADLRARLVQISTEIKDLREKKRVTGEKLRTLITEREAATAPLKDLFDEREKVKKEMYIHTSKQQELLSELASKQMAYRAYISRQKQARWEIDKVERQRSAMIVEREEMKKQLDNFEEVFMSPKMIAIKRMIQYIKTEVEKYEAAVNGQSEDKDDASNEPTAPPGLVVLKHEDDNEVDAMKRERARGKKNKKQKGAKIQEKKDVSDVLNHPLDVLSTLVSLNVPYPKTINECAGTISQLEAQFNVLNVSNEASRMSSLKRKEDLQIRIMNLEARIKEFEIQNPSKNPKKGAKTDPFTSS